eukprot:scaffold13818_cov76-Skeletonema_marinoi.AAC.1
MDAIDDTIPFTFLQLATYLTSEPINAVEKMEVVIRHPEYLADSSKSGRHYSMRTSIDLGHLHLRRVPL